MTQLAGTNVATVAALVYVFGRRSGKMLSDDERLARLATLESTEAQP